ncbi:MAG: type I DNA topoisomerase [Clostridiales Family XIII bacterium]|jgi:DNA topoisomerase-1|nr:type I DNA topoisomerase [Clostridiales Family XIII bacterium]
MDQILENKDKKTTTKATTAKSKSKTKAKTKAKSKDKQHLVIVESPSKAKTISKYLGSKFKVIASVGHVRDLPKSKLGIRKDENFEPDYINVRGKGDIIKALKKEAKNASKIYLATDPDREGEAISWHIANILGIEPESESRVEFHEITKDAVRNAIKNPRQINKNLVDAQQARRILDRLVGYEISPLLWRKIRRGLSAGRVQSAALKIICDRENIIKAFIPEEYYNIVAILGKQHGSSKKVISKLAKIGDEKVADGNKTIIRTQADADNIVDELSKGQYTIAKIDKKERKRNPFPPYTTSSLQQDASIKLGFLTKRVMYVAQQLYEGVDIKGRGTVGLVTYIRTDSVRISDQADAMVREYIKTNYNEDYLGYSNFSNKKKDIQDAHEAIRPSDVTLEPDLIESSLSKDQYKLYKLIWSRFVASRMSPAVYDAVSADIENGKYSFRATGSKLKFDGFLRVYNSVNDEDKDKMLPDLEEGEVLNLKELTADQSFTQPPARYTEASLVKELEEKNIGRPSTYVPIIGTLTDRKYIHREKKSLIPTDLGFIVTDLMETYFKEVVDSGFTAGMEDRLDEIESRGDDWHLVVKSFYDILEKELEVADKEIEQVIIEDEPTDEICDVCGKPMVIKHGRFGEFIACSGYPECKNTKPIMKKIGVACPSCGKDLVARKSKRGRVFYGCSGYPECTESFWNKPVDEKCPECGSLMTEKKTKTHSLVCSNSECGYKK